MSKEEVVTSTPREKRNATIMMLACASLWSIAGIFIKMVPWNPLVIAGGRSVIAMVVVGGFMAVTRQKIKVTRNAVITALLMMLTFMAFMAANKLTTSANAVVLQFTSPIFIMLLSFLLFKQRFRKGDLFTVVFTLFGISLFFLDQLSGGSLLGNIIAVLSGLILAGMYIATNRTENESKLTAIFLGHVFTAVIGLPVAFFVDTPLTSKAVGSILVLGVFQLGIPYILMALASRHCPPLTCNLIGVLEPLLNPLWVFLFDGEAPGVWALVGGVIVIVTITVWCIWSEKDAARVRAQQQLAEEMAQRNRLEREQATREN